MSTEAPDPVAWLIAAVNGQDEVSFLDSLTNDGHVDDWRRIVRGRDAIDAWSTRELIGAEGPLSVQPVTGTDAGNVVVLGDWRSNHANGLSRFEFVTAGDRVASMTIREG